MLLSLQRPETNSFTPKVDEIDVREREIEQSHCKCSINGSYSREIHDEWTCPAKVGSCIDDLRHHSNFAVSRRLLSIFFFDHRH